jgi:DNA primase
MITPDATARNKNRIIIPYTNGGRLVGYTSRFLDNGIPKYHNKQQRGYIFGIDLQHADWNYVIVTEGVFDAISIDGTAVLHNEISNAQAHQLHRLHRKVIVVPDFDEPGLKLIDDAMKHGFEVSIPKWDKGVKDVNDAIVQYGKIPTLLKILESSNATELKIKLAKKAFIRLVIGKKYELERITENR